MTEIPWEVIIPNIGWITVFVTILVISCTLFYKFGSWRKEIDGRLENIEKPMNLLLFIHTDEIIDHYAKSWGKAHASNPHNEKEVLLRKLREGTISREESLRLRSILEEEQRVARNSEALGAVFAIGALLFLIAIILNSLAEES